MKQGMLTGGICIFALAVFADGLPVVTSPPTKQLVAPGSTAVLTVAATGSTSFQWRFNGVDIPDATNSTLQIQNAQATNSGYYMVVAKNAIGWVPSQMAWLSVVSGSGGSVPLSNINNNYFAGQVNDAFGTPINNAKARVVAGPALDQMQSVGTTVAVAYGYYGNSSLVRNVPTVAAGQTVFYRVDITDASDTFITHSTVLNLIAGDVSPPSAYGLKFPGWWVGEGLEPVQSVVGAGTVILTNQLRIPGETFSFTNTYFAYTDYGTPTAQWRKDGKAILGATNFPDIFGNGGGVAGVFQSVLTITNAQPADAGMYDLVVLGNDWIVGSKITLSIQLTNGPGVFQSPRFLGTNFVFDLLGAAGRNYAIQWSSNLYSWNNLATLTNVTGLVTFTNTSTSGNAQFFRTLLLP